MAETTGPPLNLQRIPISGARVPSEVFNENMDTLNGLGTWAAWESWTPTWTNLSVGNGTVVAKKAEIGKLTFVRVSLIFGTATAISGDVNISLPVTAASYPGSAGATILGACVLKDASGSSYNGVVLFISTTAARIQVTKTDGTYSVNLDISSTVPFTWTNPDEINLTFCYEAA